MIEQQNGQVREKWDRIRKIVEASPDGCSSNEIAIALNIEGQQKVRLNNMLQNMCNHGVLHTGQGVDCFNYYLGRKNDV